MSIDDWDALYKCPICGKDNCVPASGSKNSPVLIIGSFPGKEELKEGRPMVGRNGGILRAELGRCSIDMKRLRITNLWQHAENKNAGCLVDGAKKAIQEAKGRKAILLIGSQATKYFGNCSVQDYNGLLIHSDYFSAKIVMPCIQPINVFSGGVGEFRLTIQKFAALVEDLL